MGALSVLAAGLLPLPAATADGSVGAVPNASRTWGTNGRVSTILSLAPSTVIIGGDFTAVVDPSGHTFPAGHLAKYDTETGAFDTTWTPSTDGSVLALASSGDSLFVGGLFTQVNGAAQTYLGAVSLSTGATVAGFAAKVNKEVDALTVVGSSLFAGGTFSKTTDASGVHTTMYAAKLAATTGAWDPAWAPVLDKRVRSLLPSGDGTGVYVGGDFTTTNGLAYAGKLTLLSVASAAIDPVFRSGTTNGTTRAPAFALARTGNALLVGAAGGGGGCSRLDATTGSTVWSKKANGDVQSIAVFGPYTYCGGHFSGPASFDTLDRQKLAAVTTDGGVTQPFAPNVNSNYGLWSMTSSPRALLVGGDFTRVDASITPFFTQFRDGSALTTAPAPTNLTAQAGDAIASLSWDIPWTDGGYATHSYAVYRQTATGWVVVGTPGAETFVDTGLTNGTTYTYAVVTRNAAGDSAFSAPVSATPVPAGTTVPSAPAGFQATSGLHVANLTWKAPSFDGGTPVTGYRILRGTSSGTETPLVDVGASTLAYADGAVTDGTQYYYTVQALNAVGASVSSPEKTATPSSGVPSQPVLTRDGSTAPTVVTLTWSVADPGGAPITKYVLVRDNIRLATIAAPTTTYTDPAPASGTHTYQVKAINSVGSSRYSNSVSVTLP